MQWTMGGMAYAKAITRVVLHAEGKIGGFAQWLPVRSDQDAL